MEHGTTQMASVCASHRSDFRTAAFTF